MRNTQPSPSQALINAGRRGSNKRSWQVVEGLKPLSYSNRQNPSKSTPIKTTDKDMSRVIARLNDRMIGIEDNREEVAEILRSRGYNESAWY